MFSDQNKQAAYKPPLLTPSRPSCFLESRLKSIKKQNIKKWILTDVDANMLILLDFYIFLTKIAEKIAPAAHQETC